MAINRYLVDTRQKYFHMKLAITYISYMSVNIVYSIDHQNANIYHRSLEHDVASPLIRRCFDVMCLLGLSLLTGDRRVASTSHNLFF